MKKSFKNAVAILLAVMMIVCSLPMTVLAADSSRSNIALQFGDVSCAQTAKTYNVRGHSTADFIKYSGLNSDKLDYNKSTGKIAGYGVGEFFTVTVLMENVSELSAAEVAINYSNSIEPAFVMATRNGVATVAYNEAGNPIADFPKAAAVPAHSGNAIHNGTTFTVGETSYVDTANRVMHANFAVQNGTDSVSATSVTAGKYNYSNTAVLATFMFKIVNDQPITFSIAKDANDKYRTYCLDSIKNGGPISEYKLYDRVSDESPALDFLGENEYNGSTTKTYTITFLDENGEELQKDTYEENAQIINVPAFPASTKVDGTNHTAYKWDKDVPATATADVTVKRVKFNEAHTWGDWKETKAPTTTETGLEERECSVCHAKETREIPKKEETHVHTWSEWKYNGDAEYVSKTNYKDGTVTRTCTDPNCPEHATETKTVAGTAFLRANTFSLVLDNSLTINFKITKANVASFSNIKLKAQTKFKGEILFDVPSKDDPTYFQYLIGMPPQYVKDDIDVVAYSTVNIDGQEVEVYGPTYSRSILYYANGIFKNANYIGPNASNRNKATKIMCVDILNYASATQKRMNYEVNDLANAALTEEQKSWATPDLESFKTVKNFTAEPNPNRTARFAGGALALDDAVIPKMTFALKADSVKLEDITVEVKVGGDTYTYNPIDNKKNFVDYKTNVSGQLGTENRYYFYFTNILANQMFETIEFRIYANGQLISDVCTYSVESYVQQAYPIKGQEDKDVFMTMLKYGTAAYNFGKA